jgi:hypothetical protein
MPQTVARKETLPLDVRKAIQEVLVHREDIRKTAKDVGVAFTIPVASLSAFRLFDVAGVIGSLMGIGSYVSFRLHGPAFRQEYLKLYRAIKKQANHPAIASLLNNPKARYLIVKNDGSLAVRYRNPILLGQPFGRRRLANPLAPKKSRRKWTQQHAKHRKMPGRI